MLKLHPCGEVPLTRSFSNIVRVKITLKKRKKAVAQENIIRVNIALTPNNILPAHWRQNPNLP